PLRHAGTNQRFNGWYSFLIRSNSEKPGFSAWFFFVGLVDVTFIFPVVRFFHRPLLSTAEVKNDDRPNPDADCPDSLVRLQTNDPQ
ncbi:hypothetical protein, partial [Atlantibacter hermannii]|uniref:hypothetical protein n=1 Tax=Atlantibacter hermannii TaxID=565 RepID=UPI0028996B18